MNYQCKTFFPFCFLINILLLTILSNSGYFGFLRKPRPKSDDPMRMSLTLDIEDNTAINGNTSLHIILLCSQAINIHFQCKLLGCFWIFKEFTHYYKILPKSFQTLWTALSRTACLFIILCTARWHICHDFLHVHFKIYGDPCTTGLYSLNTM